MLPLADIYIRCIFRFEYLLSLVGPLLKKKKNMKTVILPHQRLAMTLRYGSITLLKCLWKCDFSVYSKLSICLGFLQSGTAFLLSVSPTDVGGQHAVSLCVKLYKRSLKFCIRL